MFEDKCRDFEEQMEDLGESKPRFYVKQNADMLKACALFEDGGNYSAEEVAWYRGQMDDIDALFTDAIAKKTEQREDITQQFTALQKDPTAEFNLSYVESI